MYVYIHRSFSLERRRRKKKQFKVQQFYHRTWCFQLLMTLYRVTHIVNYTKKKYIIMVNYAPAWNSCKYYLLVMYVYVWLIANYYYFVHRFPHDAQAEQNVSRVLFADRRWCYRRSVALPSEQRARVAAYARHILPIHAAADNPRCWLLYAKSPVLWPHWIDTAVCRYWDNLQHIVNWFVPEYFFLLSWSWLECVCNLANSNR